MSRFVFALTLCAFASVASSQVIYEPAPTYTHQVGCDVRVSEMLGWAMERCPVSEYSSDVPWAYFGLQRASAVAGRPIVSCASVDPGPNYFIKEALFDGALETSDGIVIIPSNARPMLRMDVNGEAQSATRPTTRPATVPAPRAIIILPKLPEQKHAEENRDLVATAR